MLLQYLRTAEASVEAAIAWNLVHLALVAPQSAFVDILRAFSTFNGADTTGEDHSLSSMVGYLGTTSNLFLLVYCRSWQHKRDWRKALNCDLNSTMYIFWR